MTAASTPTLVDAIRQHHLLAAEQIQEVTQRLQARFPDPRALARELVQRGWLTAFQVNRLMAGKVEELLLGPYVLLDRLGEGGMGTVYKARHVKMNRLVALKVVRPELLAKPDAVRRFEREVQAAAQLAHPNVVTAYDAAQVGATHFFAMEYVEGTDLARLVKDKGPLPVAQACDFIRQAACGLAHAREQGLVHRDVKPHNLLLARNQTVKILDMGLALVARPGVDEASSSLTEAGSVMGTLDYIAPEQAMDSHTVDCRADLYSLGCTFYFLLTGKVPFPGDEALAKLIRHKCEEPTRVEKLRPDVPPAVAAVVRKLMSKRPDDRYQSPDELAAALTQVTAGVPASALAAQRPPRSSRRRWLVGGLVAGSLILLTLAGTSGLLFLSKARTATTPPAPAPAVNSGTPELAVAPFDEDRAKDHQRRWAYYLKSKPIETNSIGMQLALIPPGKFMMGSREDRSEGPPHEVEITQPFYLGVHEVTLGQFRTFIKASGHVSNAGWERSGPTEQHPVANVTWYDADAFCKWLSTEEGKQYAIPTEAQWEHACRAGSTTRFCFGENEKDLADYGWSKLNSGSKSHVVGERKPNAWGLRDVHGNLWEWVVDWHRPDYYQHSPKIDPTGPDSGTHRVLRGGSVFFDGSRSRSSSRFISFLPSHGHVGLGFRVLRRR